MEARNFRLDQLPVGVLSYITQRCPPHGVQGLRLTCKALKGAISPAHIKISFHLVQDGKQDLSQSSKLALSWPGTTHVDVCCKGFWDHQEHCSTAHEQSQALSDYYNQVVAALVFWRQLQSASVPINSSIIAVLVSCCQLRHLVLTDEVWGSDPESDPLQPLLGQQLSACLQLLKICKTLKTLNLELNVIQLQPSHVEQLARLNELEQLHDLDLELSRRGYNDDALIVSTQHIFDAVSKVKQLTHLTLHLEDFGTENEVQLGPMPHLQSISITLDDEDTDSVIGPSALTACPQLEKVHLSFTGEQVPSPVSWQYLHNLTELRFRGETMDDDLIAALASCPRLALLEVAMLHLSSACCHVLPALTELEFRVLRSDVALRVVMPQLRMLSAGVGRDYLAILNKHPTLQSMSVDFMSLMGHHAKNSSALASLHSLHCLHVTMPSARTLLLDPQPRVHFATGLLPWAASLRKLHLEGWYDALTTEHLLVLLGALPGLHVLRVGGCYSLGKQEKAAEALVWAVSICAKKMQWLKLVEVQADLLLDKADVGGLPHVTALLVGLACSPCLAVVRLLRLNSLGFERFKVIVHQVDLARQLEALPFTVELM